MATYHTSMFVNAPRDVTFDYVSDFRHATWDPRVSSARRLDGDGAIGPGARFELVSPTPMGAIVFPYRIVDFERPSRVTLRGETWFARYVDDITFEPDGQGTRLIYDALFELRGLLRLGEPLMQRLFGRVGDEATRGIPGAVERGIART